MYVMIVKMKIEKNIVKKNAEVRRSWSVTEGNDRGFIKIFIRRSWKARQKDTGTLASRENIKLIFLK